jgi:hypothetical protein
MMSDDTQSQVMRKMVDELEILVSLAASMTGADDPSCGRKYEPGSGAIIADLRCNQKEIRRLLEYDL